MNDVVKKFDDIILKSTEMYDEDGACTYESVLVEMLNFIKDNLEYRSIFVNKFEEILMSKNTPIECVAFCMRELKWDEIRKFAVDGFDMKIDPRSAAYISLLSAYEDSWQDEDLYFYYGRTN
ncbi:hypothetical protein [Pseudomonas denitrificans (nom. rej.)]|uniref:Uncharacterized protein n=1 Tax=Pseudomonas denitrificans TaxID=43306 RepID=A0A9X7R6E8_PSEDE|nr:hypothetical protein [Pseudomonas denitrificans (nom. rej.)]QEY74481.1 hypothetical protein F1C79_24275 [Pseudomonas denitrificans (nom. rej.)]